MDGFSDFGLVLIDTAGGADLASRKQQAHLLRSVNHVEVNLVLSAATGAKELRAMAERFAIYRPDGLIFSKIDEAHGPGALLSATEVLERPISCVTNGQRVPEDIVPAGSSNLLNIILGN